MNDFKKISTRDAYGLELIELGKVYTDMVVLDASVSSATRTRGFKKKFPDRHFDCGISEANMMCVAAGIASTGCPVFASTFAIFAAGRAFEQIRTSIGYTHLPVKIAATHSGIAIGADGATHQCIEDIALMKSIPGMTVISPADSVETSKCMRAIMNYDGPVYLRLSKMPVSVIYDSSYEFTIGKGSKLIEGKDATIIATGLMVGIAISAINQLRNENIFVRLISISSIKPMDEEIIISSARDTGAIVTVEDHSILGGLGDTVSQVVGQAIPVPIIRVGVNDIFGQSGSAEEVLKLYGLCEYNICAQVKKAISLK